MIKCDKNCYVFQSAYISSSPDGLYSLKWLTSESVSDSIVLAALTNFTSYVEAALTEVHSGENINALKQLFEFTVEQLSR